MGSLGRTLIFLGLGLAAVGTLLWVGERFLGLGKLPGDISLKGKGYTVSIPLVSSLVVSLLLTLILSLFGRR